MINYIKNLLNKNIFKKATHKGILLTDIRNTTDNIMGKNNIIELVSNTNNGLTLIDIASRMCVGAEPHKTNKERAEYIKKIISKGHESILEHGYFFTVFLVEDNIDIAEVTDSFKYLDYKILKTDGYYQVIVSGSIRGYKHMFRYVYNTKHPVIQYLKERIYEYLPSCYFADLIDDQILNEGSFLNNNIDDTFESLDRNYFSIVKDKYILRDVKDELLRYHEIYELYLHHIDNITTPLFSFEDFHLRQAITIEFNGISRAISQQITRHRNGISQESQRYVNYTNAKFVDPTQFKDKYDKSKKYRVFINKFLIELTAEELGTELIKVYGQLNKQGLQPEDARGFLPFNTETRLIMTFTTFNLLKFLELRTGTGAQAEVLQLAEGILEDYIEFLNAPIPSLKANNGRGGCIYKYEILNLFTKESLFNTLKPYYKSLEDSLKKEYFKFTEEILEEEIIEETIKEEK